MKKNVPNIPNVHYINGYLDAVADMNGSINHQNIFFCAEIVFKSDLKSSLFDFYNNSVKGGVKKDEYSLKIEYDLELVEFKDMLGGIGWGEQSADKFVKYIKNDSKKFRLHELINAPDEAFSIMVYGEYVLDYGKTYYLLHFGYSD